QPSPVSGSLIPVSTVPSPVHCKPAWDSFTCWPPAQAGAVLRKPCADIIASLDISLDVGDNDLATGFYAYRVCGLEGEWLWGNWTNYTECLGLINHEPQEMSSVVSLAVSYILLLFSLLSLIFLSATMFIFCYFRYDAFLSMNPFLKIIILREGFALVLICTFSPTQIQAPRPLRGLTRVVRGFGCDTFYDRIGSETLLFVPEHARGPKLYADVFEACICMKETCFQHHLLQTSKLQALKFDFSKLQTSKLQASNKTLRTCLQTFFSISNAYIYFCVFLLSCGARQVNFVFLVNIIRILVTRVKSAVSVETTQFRKAIKATVLLFPLLGITHLLFCINPKDEDMGLKEAYMVINAILQSSQGIFVAVLYCFMNSEVQTAVRNAYLRAAIRRNPNKDRSFVRGNFSQTSTVFLSHFNGSTVENSASSRLGTKIVRQLPKRATSGPQRIPRNTAAVAAV
ncbi:unnamed protein product, partial [Ixodes persulcatus]